MPPSDALPFPAIDCQIRAIVAHAERNDGARLQIRCALRNALAAVERGAPTLRIVRPTGATREHEGLRS
jgi:hypothetical protein